MLVLGGTGWLGRGIAEAAVRRGLEVVCLARGASGAVPEGARLVRADRTEPGAYDALDGDWDAVVELATAPPLVAGALDALAERAAHWTLVSSVSVYERNDEPGADETARLVTPTDPDDYGHTKVLAEQASSARLADRLLTVRPGLLAGPGDPSDRFGYWPARLARGGRVLAPESAGRRVQVVDVTDLAEWIVASAVRGRTGVANAVGPSTPFAEFLAAVRHATGFAGELVEAPDDQLLEHGVRYWAGPRSLPLWLPSSDAAFAQRAGAADLAPRPLAETIERVLQDELARGVDRPRRSGLALEEEAELLAGLG
ncbi:NAD-dependent epimerase/dehydratase family protein [Rathayibacter sp. SD072]|uniref:NAD-dependent epimerase/dehydratase family protein n=1 Tax=Rathayibacter sp. SD072 TaxID=2781731 RepID=UPI001A958A3E|nr:NAD-dependent epimerase/dehydratase family protein [Rathayibacter sp. SD072]MBO0985523.1 NAD-dependent epimerase/dehydratase family protein [Rathayibacter sp. SD072]